MADASPTSSSEEELPPSPAKSDSTLPKVSPATSQWASVADATRPGSSPFLPGRSEQTSDPKDQSNTALQHTSSSLSERILADSKPTRKSPPSRVEQLHRRKSSPLNRVRVEGRSPDSSTAPRDSGGQIAPASLPAVNALASHGPDRDGRLCPFDQYDAPESKEDQWVRLSNSSVNARAPPPVSQECPGVDGQAEHVNPTHRAESSTTFTGVTTTALTHSLITALQKAQDVNKRRLVMLILFFHRKLPFVQSIIQENRAKLEDGGYMDDLGFPLRGEQHHFPCLEEIYNDHRGKKVVRLSIVLLLVENEYLEAQKGCIMQSEQPTCACRNCTARVLSASGHSIKSFFSGGLSLLGGFAISFAPFDVPRFQLGRKYYRCIADKARWLAYVGSLGGPLGGPLVGPTLAIALIHWLFAGLRWKVLPHKIPSSIVEEASNWVDSMTAMFRSGLTQAIGIRVLALLAGVIDRVIVFLAVVGDIFSTRRLKETLFYGNTGWALAQVGRHSELFKWGGCVGLAAMILLFLYPLLVQALACTCKAVTTAYEWALAQVKKALAAITTGLAGLCRACIEWLKSIAWTVAGTSQGAGLQIWPLQAILNAFVFLVLYELRHRYAQVPWSASGKCNLEVRYPEHEFLEP